MHASLSTRGIAASFVVLALGACSQRITKPDAAASVTSPAVSEAAADASADTASRTGATRKRSPRLVHRHGEMIVGDVMKIHTIPVGAGNCQLLECPAQNKLVVFDCGSRGRGSLGWSREEVTEYVDNLIDIDTEVVVSISHADRDHSSYLPTMFADTQVSAILVGQTPNDYPVRVQQWMNQQRNDGARLIWWQGPHVDARPNDDLSCWAEDRHGGWDIDVPAYILAVNAGNTPNDASMVVSETYDTFQTIFTGDMTGATQQLIAANPRINLADTDVITGAHHGADTDGSNSHAWANANRAELVIFSSGTLNEHPRCVSVDVYRPYVLTNADQHDYECGQNGFYVNRVTNDAVLVTDTQGLINVDTNGQIFEYRWNPDATPNVGDADDDEPKPRAPVAPAN